MILNMSGGGESAVLNFKVIGNTVEPSNPRENMIWVNTDVKITKWAFDYIEPEAPIDGEICFRIGTSSPVAFNAVKKNGIMIYPVCVHQYVNGEWCDIDVKIYQNGVWVDFPTEVLYLLKDGNQYLDITGGWEGIDSSSEVLSKSAYHKEEQVGVPAYLSTSTINKVDVTEYNLLSVTLDSIDRDFYIRLLDDSNNVVANTDMVSSVGVVTMNLQNISGAYYIYFNVNGSYDNGYASASFTISEIKLEK